MKGGATMRDELANTVLDARRKRLDELFLDQPFLSATMMDPRMHGRLDDAPQPLAIPVLSRAADDGDLLKRLREARGCAGYFAYAGALPDSPAVIESMPDLLSTPNAPSIPAGQPIKQLLTIEPRE